MTSFTRSFVFIMIAAIAYIAVISYQSFHTIVVDGEHYRKRVSHLRIDSVQIRQIRGFIFSDNNELLAGSLPEYDLYLDFYSTTKQEGKKPMNIPPRVIDSLFTPDGGGSRAVAEISGHRHSAAEYAKGVHKAYARRDPSYPLLRTVSYMDYKRLLKMPYFSMGRNRSGLIPKERAHRYRPYGERRMASCVIGDVYAGKDTVITIDGERYRYLGVGRSGLELACDSLLRGRPGWGYKKKIRSRLLEVTQVQPIHGANVHTTLNVEMEDILDRALAKRICDLHAAGGWAAVMEVETGKIKAISNLRRISDSECIEDHNHLFEDLVDPGSTFKTISYMVLLDQGKITPETVVDTRNTAQSPGTFNYHGKQIRDDHPVGVVTADEAICQSSNIAVAMLTTQAYEHDPKAYLDAIDKMKILDDLDLRGEFPKAQRARKRTVGDRSWSAVSLGQICYGYETQIPGIYLLNFYNAIANGGRLMRPYIVDYVEKDGDIIYRQSPKTINRKICKSETLKAVQHALLGVVEHGTAAGKPGLPGARSNKVLIAGKTGTAQRWANGSFSGNGHNVSFVGYFPADKPKYTCIVVINTQGSGYGRPGGGYMAGPVFRTLAEEIYALHCRRSVKELPRDTMHAFYPSVKGGIAADLDYVLDKLDLSANLNCNKHDVAVAEPLEVDEQHYKVKYGIDRRKITPGTVPNVHGMGASDALFLLEQAGLKVGISGTGQVVSQSLPAGSACRKGQFISITLH